MCAPGKPREGEGGLSGFQSALPGGDQSCNCGIIKCDLFFYDASFLVPNRRHVQLEARLLFHLRRLRAAARSRGF